MPSFHVNDVFLHLECCKCAQPENIVLTATGHIKIVDWGESNGVTFGT